MDMFGIGDTAAAEMGSSPLVPCDDCGSAVSWEAKGEL